MFVTSHGFFSSSCFSAFTSPSTYGSPFRTCQIFLLWIPGLLKMNINSEFFIQNKSLKTFFYYGKPWTNFNDFSKWIFILHHKWLSVKIFKWKGWTYIYRSWFAKQIVISWILFKIDGFFFFKKGCYFSTINCQK